MNLGGPGGGNAELDTVKPVFYSLINSIEFFLLQLQGHFFPNFRGENYEGNNIFKKI